MICCSCSLACRLTCAASNLHFTIGRLDKLTTVHCKRRSRTSTRTSSDGCPKLLPISDNVSVVILGALVHHFRFFNKWYNLNISHAVHDFDFITKEVTAGFNVFILI